MKWTIYGTNDCIYCEKVKDVIQRMGDEFEFINIQENKMGYRKIVNQLRCRTVPQCFIETEVEDHHIGGYTDVIAHYTKIGKI